MPALMHYPNLCQCFRVALHLKRLLMHLFINMQIYKQQKDSRGKRAVFSQKYINSHN